MDASGNVYVAGDTTSAMDGQAAISARDFFITKYDSSGARQWTVEDGATGVSSPLAEVLGINLDLFWNVYVTGLALGSVDGQPHTLWDFFITKYDPSGVRQWTVQDGVFGTLSVLQPVMDSSGNIYVTGITTAALDGQTLHGMFDFFITKYDTNGVHQWTVEDGAAGAAVLPGGIVLDPAGSNVYIVGGAQGGAIDGQTLHGLGDFFITKYNSGGVRQWTVEDGAAGASTGAVGIVVDSSGNNAYLSGITNAAIDGQALHGTRDFFLTKYDSTGVRQWTVEDGAVGATIAPSGIILDPTGSSAYLSGSTDAGIDGQTLQGKRDFFMTKYNSTGVRQWTVEDGTAGATAYASGMILDSTGSNIYFTGAINAAIDGQTLQGTQDFFITEYDTSGVRHTTVEGGGTNASVWPGAPMQYPSGNLCVAGTTTSGAIKGQSLYGVTDLFLVKY